jgi:hypothetical protein
MAPINCAVHPKRLQDRTEKGFTDETGKEPIESFVYMTIGPQGQTWRRTLVLRRTPLADAPP